MKLNYFIVAIAVLLSGASVCAAESGNGSLYTFPSGGFVILAEQRFDPWVQRLMAERSLKAMPLRDGRLYYFYPTQGDPYLEEMQIRYLEELLEKQKNNEPTGE